ncbi:MAG: hypothetical protein N2Z23_03155 [Pyrinomonadaceae bacterium]|nr:hypothetical protein [Pyrinomonadaceae bacterium]MCX7639425.1 hypothetical protein [Pyrinomonadaceae bacterium]MDW8304525.1 hypothetical protein [Acidobacteriota bacterium]
MKTVLHLKNVPFVPKYLQELIVKTFQLAPFEKVDLIVPVPISKVRLSERGFNQASLLAKPLSKMTKIKLDETALIRHIHTKRHSPGMDKKARQMSVKQAFSVASPEKVKGRNILLIDDVFTSGATASNCAIALKEKGALKVYVLAVARAFII